ncbi:Short-chain dehydrogenase reductase 3a [Escovopsis weberi]|uniref:Short-chain dehydrogenase reductase 3a n=1 Tax=Escovopsis weberi TaxID=150374 RepID=A0A0M9VXI4_ESCWE|nr:Short-chain dehydrogenase reductase 3a [Escovopsis weberi]
MTASLFSVSGKTAIVTGAGSGINLAFARLLLSRGCNVVFADLSLRPEAKDLVAEHAILNKGQVPRAIWIETDVTSWPALERMFEAALAQFGDFDIVCPGAGIYEPPFSNFWYPPGSASSRDDVDGGRYALLDINVTHPIRATQMALSYWLHPRRALQEDGPGQAIPSNALPANPKRIIHVSSIAAQDPGLITPMYVASKHAISGFVRSLAPLEADFGVRVNAVAPGVVQTPLWTENPEKLKLLDLSTDVWVTAEEVAEAMLRCVEDEELVGGTVLEVGAGRTRQVHAFNDPGPSQAPGMTTRNKKAIAREEVASCLGNEKLWGAWRKM